jgi:hypothetical protein
MWQPHFALSFLILSISVFAYGGEQSLVLSLKDVACCKIIEKIDIPEKSLATHAQAIAYINDKLNELTLSLPLNNDLRARIIDMATPLVLLRIKLPTYKDKRNSYIVFSNKYTIDTVTCDSFSNKNQLIVWIKERLSTSKLPITIENTSSVIEETIEKYSKCTSSLDMLLQLQRRSC